MPSRVPNESSDTPADVHLPWFWTLWRRNRSWNDNLHRKMAHKALDIPEDNEVIEANRITNGIGWKEIATLGALGLGAAALVRDKLPIPAAVPPPAASSPADSEYEVRFFDRAGKPIQVPHIDTRKLE